MMSQLKHFFVNNSGSPKLYCGMKLIMIKSLYARKIVEKKKEKGNNSATILFYLNMIFH